MSVAQHAAIAVPLADPSPNVVALDLADVLTSGMAGRRLQDELWRRFPKASRADVFLGVSMAITLFECDLTIAGADLIAMKARLPDGG